MPVRFTLEHDNIGTFTVSGKLGLSELQTVQAECETAIKALGTIRLLVLAEDFTGWEDAEGWEDTSFAEQNDPYIIKMAIVGDMKWKDMAYLFTLKDLRPMQIEYFEPGQLSAARAWLAQDQRQGQT